VKLFFGLTSSITRRKEMFKISTGLGCVFAAAITASAAQANECGEVSIMQGDWVLSDKRAQASVFI
jgi:hydroxymethylpyrimidine/phosphomethylpyrimidine kinase